MKNFKDNGFKKGGKDFGGRPKFAGGSFGGDKRANGGKFGGGHDRGSHGGDRSEMFAATCSSCHKSCEVPFRPSNDKPVYCSACFGKKNEYEPRTERGGGFGDDRKTSNFRSERPLYQRSSQDARPASTVPSGLRNADLEEVKQRLAMIETRLTRIFDLLKQSVTPVMLESEVIAGTSETVVLPKKERKPKTQKVTSAAPKKVVKKTAKKAVKKAGK